jgi:hypothetical protein
MPSVAEVTEETKPSGTGQVVVGTTVPASTPRNLAAKKLIVAVHGIGDQASYATLQAVFNQFCRFHGEPSGIPLGAFHNGQSTFSVDRHERQTLEALAFAEVYWAAIPRRVVAQKHTLEEAKRWATTIIERLRLRMQTVAHPEVCRRRDFELSTQILHEMIETIAVADRLCYVADRAGLFTFDLRRVLDDYLGDVQIVTEFRTQRQKILNAFRDVMTKAQASCPNAEIYLITHSEGTVVSFLGLLDAFRDPGQKTWAQQVRGLMTLGSPIDKHLFFWPDLFGDTPPVHAPGQPIAWRNYYDYGDPVGFELDAARDWLAVPPPSDAGTGITWRDVFEFEPKHDFGFTRYPFPGKAHLDYWADATVFDHFIGTVIDAPPPGESGNPAAKPEPPGTVSAKLAGWILPYVGVFALLFVAAYVLTKAVLGATGAETVPAVSILLYALTGGLLLFGTTIAARVPRLTRSIALWVSAWLIAVACGAIFMLAVPDAASGIRLLPNTHPGTSRILAAVAIVVISSLVGAVRPDWGATPMILTGGLGIAGFVAYAVGENLTGPIWPVFLAGAACLYLWWLAALLFDLVFVWHLYIRSSLINRRLREMTSPAARPAAGATVSSVSAHSGTVALS